MSPANGSESCDCAPVTWAYGTPCPAMVSPNVGPRKEGKLLYPDHHLIRCMKSGFRPVQRQNNTTNISSNTFNNRTTTRPTGHNGLQTNNPSNPTDLRNRLTCFRCGELGHMRGECRKRVFCNHCRSYNHDTKACRKQHDNTPSRTHSQIATGYHPTATPPPLMGTAAATQPIETHNKPLFNLLDNNQPRTSTLMHTPHNGTSPATPADFIEGITQIMNQVTNDNKRDDTSKKMMKNIKIFDSSNNNNNNNNNNLFTGLFTTVTKVLLLSLLVQFNAPGKGLSRG